MKKLPEGWERSLPVELLEDIFAITLTDDDGRTLSGITHKRSTIQPLLRSLAGVCKAWYAMVTPMLYQEVYISSSRALAAFARSVSVHPHLQPLVHSFLYSSHIFESAAVEYSQAENWNLSRIYRACANLNRLVVSRGLDGFPTDDSLVLRLMGCGMDTLMRITRLEIKLPDGMPCNGRLIFSNMFTLPVLQELILEVLPVETEPDSIFPRIFLPTHTIEWPCMPQLTRLCIMNWNVRHAGFRLPPHSEKLRILELLGVNCSSVLDFFYIILRGVPALESLTITVSRVSNEHVFAGLGSLSFLTELCIPLRLICDWQYYWFPDSLRNFVLAGCPEKDFNETDIGLLRNVESRLGDFLECKLAGKTLRNLKVVRVVIDSIWMWSLGPVITFERPIKAADAAGVKISFGFLRCEENTFRDNVKQKLLNSFPKLERMLK